MRSKRLVSLAVGLTLGLAGVVGTAVPAFALAVANDDPAGAVVITSLPASFSQGTTDATTSAEETALNASCGSPTVEHGVWYQYTAADNANLRLDVSASDYGAGIMVLTGSPGSFTLQDCEPGLVDFGLTPGTTYSFLIFGDGFTGATGGNLVLAASLHVPVPAPTVDLTVDKRGTVDKQGGATISGTVTCTSTDGSGVLYDVYGSLRQTVGRTFIDGYFDVYLASACDGIPVRWTAYVASTTGKYSGGQAANVSIADGCSIDQCTSGYTEAKIQLSKAVVR